ncbi:hypothetical protein CPB85DRAFT_1447719 [Mucidula mucida]|nr:hypothetical protein CPB85DRAFT_1447719 [Mucidula mucida]
MAKVFLQVLNELKVLHCVSAITLDNAFDNGTMMAAIKRILKKRRINFDKDANHVLTSCFLHCINLAVKADFDNLTVVNADDKELNGCDLELDEHFEDLTLDAGY